jgi:copper chaperone CopZ
VPAHSGSRDAFRIRSLSDTAALRPVSGWRGPALLLFSALAVTVITGCGGSSKPAYCSDRTSLQNAVKGLQSLTLSNGVSGLKTQLTTIEGSATAVVSSAKSDFPDQTSAVKTSVDSLANTVKSVSSPPSAAQIASITADASAVVSSVKSFSDATSSKCS